MNRIVTICGSMRFQEHMRAAAQRLEPEEDIALQCVYVEENRPLSPQDIRCLEDLHDRKIELSDAIYVVNVGGYIGEPTRREIEYARARNKEVLYPEPVGV